MNLDVLVDSTFDLLKSSKIDIDLLYIQLKDHFYRQDINLSWISFNYYLNNNLNARYKLNNGYLTRASIFIDLSNEPAETLDEGDIYDIMDLEEESFLYEEDGIDMMNLEVELYDEESSLYDEEDTKGTEGTDVRTERTEGTERTERTEGTEGTERDKHETLAQFWMTESTQESEEVVTSVRFVHPADQINYLIDRLSERELTKEDSSSDKKRNRRPPISRKVKHEAWVRFNGYSGIGRCFCCGGVLYKNSIEHEAGHVIPHKFGGKDTLENIRPVCRYCNRGKKTAFNRGGMHTMHMYKYIMRHRLFGMINLTEDDMIFHNEYDED